MFRIYLVGLVVALIFLGFVSGYSAGFFGWLKGGPLHDAVLAARAVYFQVSQYQDSFASTRFGPRFLEGSGVTRHDPQQAWQGYTLYTSGHATEARLIDMEGNEVHRWTQPFADAWPEPSHLRAVAGAESMTWRKAHLYPDGSLLVIYEGEGITPSGHGLAKLDRDSEVLWTYSAAVHHDVTVDDSGNIYTLTNEILSDAVGGFPELEPPILNDYIVVLDPDGNEIRNIDLIEAFRGTRFSSLLSWVPNSPLGDYLHTNNVDPVDATTAEAFPFAEPGDIVLSMRELESIALLNPASGKITWVMKGPWIGQHDPDLLPNGNMLIYDNKGGIGNVGGPSRIIEFNPMDHSIRWQYTANRENPFSNPIRGSQQRLPNGNTLITDSGSGRLFEVTETGEIVWEFFNPVSAGKEDSLRPVVTWGQRFAADELPFLLAD